MGAWWYVRPRLHAALRFHLRREAWRARAAAAAAASGRGAGLGESEAQLWGYGEEAQDGGVVQLNGSKTEAVVRFVGRPPAASPATASFK
jgi:hypothetical protein